MGVSRSTTWLKKQNKVLRASNASSDWRAYVDFVNNVVVDGLAKIVYTSLDFLFEQVDADTIVKNDTLPMIEVKLDLVSVKQDGLRQEEVQFIPALETAGGKGIRDLVNSWIGSFFNVSTQFKRLDNEGNYLREMHGDYSVMMLMSVINETLESNEKSCLDVKAQYDEHSYLWLTNMEEFFEDFKATNVITRESGLVTLDTAKYEEALTKYEKIRESIQQLQSPVDIGWLRINTQPIKSELIKWASRWIDLFTNHLKDTLTQKLTGLHEFHWCRDQGP